MTEGYGFAKKAREKPLAESGRGLWIDDELCVHLAACIECVEEG